MTLAAIRILALVAAYRERYGDDATAVLLAALRRQSQAKPRPQTCRSCGRFIAQRRRGRPRQYCPGCVVRLGHRSMGEQLRKTGAENV